VQRAIQRRWQGKSDDAAKCVCAAINLAGDVFEGSHRALDGAGHIRLWPSRDIAQGFMDLFGGGWRAS
jgi:hypothetical protein